MKHYAVSKIIHFNALCYFVHELTCKKIIKFCNHTTSGIETNKKSFPCSCQLAFDEPLFLLYLNQRGENIPNAFGIPRFLRHTLPFAVKV